MNIQWTEPFHGVTHAPANNPYSLKTHWVTVEEFDTFSRLSMHYPGCGFSPHQQHFNSAEEAKLAGERYLKLNATEGS